MEHKSTLHFWNASKRAESQQFSVEIPINNMVLHAYVKIKYSFKAKMWLNHFKWLLHFTSRKHLHKISHIFNDFKKHWNNNHKTLTSSLTSSCHTLTLAIVLHVSVSVIVLMLLYRSSPVPWSCFMTLCLNQIHYTSIKQWIMQLYTCQNSAPVFSMHISHLLHMVEVQIT